MKGQKEKQAVNEENEWKWQYKIIKPKPKEWNKEN